MAGDVATLGAEPRVAQDARSGERDGVQVLERACDVLEVLAGTRDKLGLSDIARQSSLSKTTAHRILQTLVKRGYATHEQSQGYAIGPKLFELATSRIDALDLQTEAKPRIVTLSRALDLTSYLGVMDGPFISIIEKETYARTDDDFTQVGRRYPAHCSSMGKCMLACLSSHDLDDLLSGFDLVAFTPHTITDKDAFRQHLRQVREQGWASDIEESRLDHRCVAAPVFDYRGDAIAVIGVSGSNDELPDEQIETIAAHVVHAAMDVSSAMGYVP